MDNILLILLSGLLLLSCSGPGSNELETVLMNDPDLKKIVQDPSYEIQIIYTRIHKAEDSVSFKTYTYGLDSAHYFYPASTVKLPVALLALEKLNELNIEGLDRNSAMLTDSAYSGQKSVHIDSSQLDLKPTIEQYIKKILVASDNEGFNRLYEFLGQDYIHNKLAQKTYTDTRIRHRLEIALTPDENKHVNPIRFYKDTTLVYEEPLRKSDGNYYDSPKTLRGSGYIKNGDRKQGPFDFTDKNFFPLDEQHRLIQSLLFPDEFRESSFNLTEDQREFFLSYMNVLPRESGIDIYSNEDEYYDSYVKFLMYGDTKERMPQHVRIYNKIGLAYGFAIDNAYIRDTKNNIEFFLSAVIHANKNKVYNDGEYEYENIAFPFLARLGRKIYEYENQNK